MKILVIFALFATALAAKLPDGDYTPVSHTLKILELSDEEISRQYGEKPRGERLTNGFPVMSDDRFPFVTDNQFFFPDLPTFFCTGAILSTTWTITARQCIQ